jgi:vitamin B12 transport system substrate-binding protein
MLVSQSHAANNAEKQKLRIVALAPHIVELLFDIGAGEQIIATTSFANHPEAAKSIPVVGNYARLQIERIVELQPDIIISWKSGNPADDIARLKSFGLKVIYSNPTELIHISEDIRRFGTLTGREQQALAVAERFDIRLRELQISFSHKTPINTFYELSSQPLMTVAGSAWPQQHLKICGAANVFDNAESDYPKISFEHVLSAMPDLIIQPRSGKTPASNYTDWRKWSAIPASQMNHVIYPDADRLHRMSTTVIDELVELCTQIDEIRQDLNIREKNTQ